MNSGRNLALFDFDGTITRKDSFLLFIRYTSGELRFGAGCLVLFPRIVAFLLKRYSNQRLKEDFLRFFFQGTEVQELERQARAFTAELLPRIVRPLALERLREHQQAGDKVVLVSATPALILQPWCDRNGIDLLATELQIRNGRLTGSINGRNCRGQEKVRRILGRYALGEYSAVYAYGDSAGDLPMLDLADHRFYRPFV